MDRRQSADLDNYITGHYGEDQMYQNKGSKMKQQQASIDNLLTGCVHYCAQCGHFWQHDPGHDKDGVSKCDWKLIDTSSRQPTTPSVKLLSLCPRHKPRPPKEDPYEYA